MRFDQKPVISLPADKPAKYPLAFHLVSACVLIRMNLLPYLYFDLDLCLDTLSRLNPGIPLLQTSAYLANGVDPWLA